MIRMSVLYKTNPISLDQVAVGYTYKTKHTQQDHLLGASQIQVRDFDLIQPAGDSSAGCPKC